jgi:hypothetical protein
VEDVPELEVTAAVGFKALLSFLPLQLYIINSKARPITFFTRTIFGVSQGNYAKRWRSVLTMRFFISILWDIFAIPVP